MSKLGMGQNFGDKLWCQTCFLTALKSAFTCRYLWIQNAVHTVEPVPISPRMPPQKQKEKVNAPHFLRRSLSLWHLRLLQMARENRFAVDIHHTQVEYVSSNQEIR
jgi:hypothetical protein